MHDTADRSTKDTRPRKTAAPDLAPEELLQKPADQTVSGEVRSGSLTPGSVIHLQRIIGNQAVQRMLEETAVSPDRGEVPPVAVQSTAPQTSQPGKVPVQRAWDWSLSTIGSAVSGAIGAVGHAVGGAVSAVGHAVGSAVSAVGHAIGSVASAVGSAIAGLVARPTVDPKVVIKKTAESLVQTGGTGSKSDSDAVVQELIKIPLPALSALKKKGTKVVVCHDSVTEVRTDLKGVHPRGWPKGKTWDSVPGLYDSGSNRVIIATRKGKVPPTGDGHGSANLVLHEVGHAIGAAIGAGAGGEDDPNFIAARNKDKKRLDAYEGQAGHAGVEETYAESFARFYSHDPTDAKLYPNLHAYWGTNPFVAKKP